VRRRAAVIALAIVAFLVTVAPASAAPTTTMGTASEASYTSVHLTGTVDAGPFFSVWGFEYSTDGVHWSGFSSQGGLEGSNEPGYAGPQPVEADLTGLKAGTEYFARLAALDNVETFEGSEVVSPAPYTTFTTEHVDKPIATLDPVTNITLDSAHFSGSVYPNAPPGPLNPAEKAAYKTEWRVECRPGCPTGGVEGENTAIEGDVPGQPFSFDPIRLETNTFYEVTLSATNAAGTTTSERSFRTPLILPGVKPAPGGSAGKGAFNVGGLVTPYSSKITDCHIAYGPTAEYVYETPCSPNPVGRNEVQSIGLVDNPESGPLTFKILFRGQITEDISVGAGASVVEEELKALSAIGPEGVTNVERSFGFFAVSYKIDFDGPLASTNLAPLRVLTGSETAATPGGSFAETLVDGGNNNPVLVEAHLTGLTPGATYHYQVFATNSVGTAGSGDASFTAPFAAEDAPCPNEAVRIENNSTSLPECRAYELVTSAFKASSPATLGGMDPTSEGSVAYSSRAGNINNSGSGAVVNGYVAIRGEDRWETVSNLNGGRGSPYAPPYSIGSAEAAHGIVDLLHSIWYLKSDPTQEHPEAYLRFPDGHFELIAHGDPGPTGADLFAGAAQDSSGRIHTIWQGGTGLFNAKMFPVGLWEVIDTARTNNGVATRVDLDNSGNPISGCNPPNSNLEAEYRSISNDARVIYFMAQPCESAAGIHQNQLWARVEGSKSYFASESNCFRAASDPGGECNAPSNLETEDFATDGSRAFFKTAQQLVNADTNEETDLYAYTLPTDTTKGHLDCITGSSTNPQYEHILRASNDGSTVYFLAKGVLAKNHDSLDQPAIAGDENLYVWQKNEKHPFGTTKFIGRIANPGDLDYLSYFSEITPNGGYLLFMSSSSLVETDTDNSFDIYRYDAEKGELQRVSTDSSGVGGNADGLSGYLPYNTGNRHDHPAMSSDGEEIVFTTAEALSPDDGNGTWDVYLWKKGRTYLISSGAVGPNGEEGSAPPPFATALIDGSGTDIYFSTAQAMTADDVDTVSDVYDARVGGGWSFAESSPCSGEGCLPSAVTPAKPAAPATDRIGGRGNYHPATVSIKPLSSSEKAKLAAGGRVGLKLKVSGPGEALVKGTAQIGREPKQVLASKYSVVQAGQVQVPISLSDLAQARLRGGGSLKIALSVTFADAAPTTSTLTLKAPSARPGHSRGKRG
jgi:hypothetical protein